MAIAASSSAAEPSRPRISVAGVSSRSAILISMNDAPQMSASSVSMTIGRRIYLVKRNAAGSREIPPQAPVTLNHLSEVAAQPLCTAPSV